MVSLEELQLLAQLIDSMEAAVDKLEKAYQENNSEDFSKSKKAILDFQRKISEILSQK